MASLTIIANNHFQIFVLLVPTTLNSTNLELFVLKIETLPPCNTVQLVGDLGIWVPLP